MDYSLQQLLTALLLTIATLYIFLSPRDTVTELKSVFDHASSGLVYVSDLDGHSFSFRSCVYSCRPAVSLSLLP